MPEGLVGRRGSGTKRRLGNRGGPSARRNDKGNPMVSLLSSPLLSAGVLAALSTAAAAPAQTPPPERVIHLWVDPIYGSDSGASAQNPIQGAAYCSGSATALQPPDVLDVNQSPSPPLLNSPWPYRTITAAIDDLPLLPYTAASGVVWKYAIIHLMPGVYGQFTTPHEDALVSGNGETFPIYLPNYVSIQGTSALNTLFDLGIPNTTAAGSGPAFHFGVDDNGVPCQGIGSFVDSISVFGAGIQGGRPDRSSGIYVGPDPDGVRSSLPARPTITNCYFFRNVAGVTVAADEGEQVEHHGTMLFNNTFVANQVGLWNGQIDPASPTAGPVEGVNKLVVVNNIFDAEVPSGCDPQPASWSRAAIPASTGFAGVHAEDMAISSASPGLSPPGDYNAYEWDASAGGNYNPNSTVAVGVFPRTVLRLGTAGTQVDPIPVNSRNLSRFTGWFDQSGGRPHGVLFVRDLFCHASVAGVLGLPPLPPLGANPSTFDLSPMDFRLAPSVSDAPLQLPGAAPGTVTDSANPLIDNGWFGQFPMTMANQQVVLRAPGRLVLSDPSWHTWAFDAFDHDAEGFGNPRVYDHPDYLTPSNGGPGEPPMDPQLRIDIGADEVGGAVVAGYKYGTTSFIAALGSDPFAVGSDGDNRFVWYIGPAGASATSGALPFSVDVQAPFSASVSPTPYANRTWWGTWDLGPPAGFYTPSWAGVAPHLLPDVHPWWVTSSVGQASNPNWDPCGPVLYNSLLFADPASGVIHPPGAGNGFAGNGGFQYEWLDEVAWGQTAATSQLGTFYAGGPQIALLSFDDWCFGVSLGTPQCFGVFPPTYDPTAAPTGVKQRISTEGSFFGVRNNLQSFDVFVTPSFP